MVKISAHKSPGWVIIGCAAIAGSGVMAYCTALWTSLDHGTALLLAVTIALVAIVLYLFNVAFIRNASLYSLILFLFYPLGVPAFAFGIGIAAYHDYYNSLTGSFFAFTFLISTYFAIQRGIHADLEKYLIAGLKSKLIRNDINCLDFYTVPNKNRPVPTPVDGARNYNFEAKFPLSWLDGGITNFGLLLGCVALPFAQKAVYVDQMARHENPVPLAFVFMGFFFYLSLGRSFLSNSIVIFRLDRAIKNGEIRLEGLAHGWVRGGIRRPS